MGLPKKSPYRSVNGFWLCSIKETEMTYARYSDHFKIKTANEMLRQTSKGSSLSENAIVTNPWPARRKLQSIKNKNDKTNNTKERCLEYFRYLFLAAHHF